MINNTVVQTKNIAKVYILGNVEVCALSDINLEISKGEFSSIMGPSGCGKSTLMNLIGCLDRPSSGQILLDGIDVSKVSDNDLAEIRNKKVGFVFQTYNLLPKLTAMENVELPLIYAGANTIQRKKKSMELLDKVGIADRANHKPTELSGGQSQRVAIARALANDPTIILADEPTGNLDTKSGHEIMELFYNLNKQGVTIIMVTHNPEIAESTHRVIHLLDGRVVEDTNQ